MQVEPVVGKGCGTIRDSDREAPAEQQPAHDVARQSVDEDGADGHGREDEWEGHSNECGVGETTGQCLHEAKQDERERGDPQRYEGRSVPAAAPMSVGSNQGGWLTPDAHEACDLFDDAITGEILDRGPFRNRYGTPRGFSFASLASRMSFSVPVAFVWSVIEPRFDRAGAATRGLPSESRRCLLYTSPSPRD